jgi:hypothetical protein
MPALNAPIEDEAVEPFAGTRVLPTVRSVTFDCFCEGFHLQIAANIANMIVISGWLGKYTEHNQTKRDYKTDPRNQLDQRSQSWSDYDLEPCNRFDWGSEKPHIGSDVQAERNAEFTRIWLSVFLCGRGVSGN